MNPNDKLIDKYHLSCIIPSLSLYISRIRLYRLIELYFFRFF